MRAMCSTCAPWQAATLEAQLVRASIAASIAAHHEVIARNTIVEAPPIRRPTPSMPSEARPVGPLATRGDQSAVTAQVAPPAPLASAGSSDGASDPVAAVLAAATAARIRAEHETQTTEAAARMLAIGEGSAAAGCVKLCAAMLLLARDAAPRIARRAHEQLHALVPHSAAPPPAPVVSPGLRSPQISRRAERGHAAPATAVNAGTGRGAGEGAARNNLMLAADAGLVGPRPRLTASCIPPWLGTACQVASGGGSTASSHPGTPPTGGVAVPQATTAHGGGRDLMIDRSGAPTPGTPDPAPARLQSATADGSGGAIPPVDYRDIDAVEDPPLELGGDMFKWGTQMLAHDFPIISDSGEIVQLRLPALFAGAATLAATSPYEGGADLAGMSGVAGRSVHGAAGCACGGAAASAPGGPHGGAPAAAGWGRSGKSGGSASHRSSAPSPHKQLWALRLGEKRGEVHERERIAELKCEEQIATLDGGSARCSALALHATAPLLVSATAREELTVWDYKTKTRLNAFANSNPAGSRCTGLLLVENPSSSLLLVGSTEGVVRAWRNWRSPGGQQLASAFHAVDRSSSATPTPHAAAVPTREGGLAMCWQPGTALLSTACITPFVRIWDVAAERCVAHVHVAPRRPKDASANEQMHVRCLAADVHSPLLVAGGSDGVTRVLDPRAPAASAVVSSLGPFPSNAAISHVTLQATNGMPWLSAATALGDIAVWDWRKTASGGSINSVGSGSGAGGGSGSASVGAALGAHTIGAHRSGLSALSLHSSAPLLASGSRNQFIKLFDVHALRDGGAARELHTIRYFDGFLGARIGPVTCLAFHPTRVLLAVGATDSVLSIYASA